LAFGLCPDDILPFCHRRRDRLHALLVFALIARKRDAKKMLEAFSLFEEEHVMPDKGVLSYVAKVLQSLGQPVPFEIPKVTCFFCHHSFYSLFANHLDV
jgi:hypothetical protein